MIARASLILFCGGSRNEVSLSFSSSLCTFDTARQKQKKKKSLFGTLKFWRAQPALAGAAIHLCWRAKYLQRITAPSRNIIRFPRHRRESSPPYHALKTCVSV